MLNIAALRLTRKEREQLPRNHLYVASHKWSYATVEAAQLAKVVQGLRDWLRDGPWPEHGCDLRDELEEALEQANIKRPMEKT